MLSITSRVALSHIHWLQLNHIATRYCFPGCACWIASQVTGACSRLHPGLGAAPFCISVCFLASLSFLSFYIHKWDWSEMTDINGVLLIIWCSSGASVLSSVIQEIFRSVLIQGFLRNLWIPATGAWLRQPLFWNLILSGAGLVISTFCWFILLLYFPWLLWKFTVWIL